MSSLKYRLTLSPKAEQDIENILRYAGETWAEKQITVYRAGDSLVEVTRILRKRISLSRHLG